MNCLVLEIYRRVRGSLNYKKNTKGGGEKLLEQH